MKLEMESKEIKDIEMGVNNELNSQHKQDSVENISGASINQSITNDSQLNKKLPEKLASVLKEDCIIGSLLLKNSYGGINNVESASELNSTENPQNKMPSAEENISASKLSNRILNIGDTKTHRQNVQYSSESSDFETDESSDTDEFFKNLHKNVVLPPVKVTPVMKTKGELLPLDLPPVEDLHITENVTNLQKIGNILHTVINPDCNEFFVIVESNGNSSPLDEDSVLFLSSGEPLGKIHDVFGNVNKPTYVVRFNKPEDIHNKGVTKSQDVYYSPSNGELTHYVLVDQLKQQKGSDASWKDNNEPPDDQIDYSDDEQEKIAKQKRRAKNRKNDRNWDSEEEVVDVTPNKIERKRVVYNQERAVQARPSRNKFRSPTSGPPRSPHSYSSSRSFGSTPSPPSTFSPDTYGLQRNAPLSQPCGPTSLNTRFGCFQQSVSSSQSFGPFPQSNVPTPTPFGLFTQSRVPTPQSFGTFSPSSVPSFQSLTAPPTSNVFAPPNLAPAFATGAPQQNPSSLMPAPQNNVPLQQQFMLQSQQPVGNFLSHPPPNTNQNFRTFLHQNHSFTAPTFGALSAAVQTMPNTSNQSLVNQIRYSFGTTNGPQNSLLGNLNISQPRNITPMNSNGNQGQSYGIVQSSVANSFIFPPRNSQHNNIHTPVTLPVFGPNQSALSSPCPTPPFVLYPTPPPLSTQQGFPILSNPHPPVLPNQTPPPTFHSFALNLPVVRSPMPPQQYPYS